LIGARRGAPAVQDDATGNGSAKFLSKLARESLRVALRRAGQFGASRRHIYAISYPLKYSLLQECSEVLPICTD
jgi:hypothetical protein